MPSKRATTSSAETLSENAVKLTISAIRTLTSGFSNAIDFLSPFSLSAISFGIMLCNSCSDLSLSSTRNFEYNPIGKPKIRSAPIMFEIARTSLVNAGISKTGCDPERKR